MLYVGGGDDQRRAPATSCAALAEQWQLPVVTTLMAKSAFPETHELHFGWPGMHGAKWSNWAMNKCDVLVAVGARFDDRVTGKLAAFAPGATVVHLDVDAAEIGKLRHADIPVVGPLKQILAELGERVRGAERRGRRARRPRPWLAQLAAWREEFPLRYGEDGDLLKPQQVLESLQALTAGRDDVIWTTGVGQHQMWAMQYLLCDRPRSFITSGGLGTMGYGLPAAVGAKAARPDATVVCVDGDGCFQMTCQELATSVTEDLPIVVVIVNNGYLGHGPAVAGHVLRGAVLAGPPRRGLARLREARRGVRRRRPPRRHRGRARAPLSRRRSPAAARRSSTAASTRPSTASR